MAPGAPGSWETQSVSSKGALPPMAQSMSNYDAALHEHVLAGLRKSCNEKAKLDAQAQKNTEDVEGQYARLALHAAPNGGIGSRGANGASLPTAGEQGIAEQQIPMKYHYGRIKLE